MPKELPKTYNPSEVEDKIYKKWEESGYFNPDKCIADGITDKDAKGYSIVMPPPNATGTLHLGHAAMLALEDILIRYHRMKGERTLWILGTDHASIATQTKVEKIIKEEGTNRHELGREQFLGRVEEFVEGSRNTIRNQIRKMGSSCDWSREAFTFDEIRNKAVREVFKMMYDDGLIYRGERIVNWCPRCSSTLADDEVEYKSQKAKLYTFKYSHDFPFAISTTRPETKLGDTAVAVNPKDERYKKYIGQIFEVDFCGIKLKLKIIADRGVDMEFGTGAVGVTPAHSMVDWQMAEGNNLEIIKVIDEDGKIKEGFGEFSGHTVIETREMLVNKLSVQGLIEKEEEIDNNLSVCYRCETPIEPLPSLQWFINVDRKIPKFGKSIKELCLEAVRTGVFGRDKIKIVPERFEKNYFHWMENLRDWCISRQIWYGHRIPVYYRNMKIQKNEKNEAQKQDEEIKKLRNKEIESNEEIYVGVESPKIHTPNPSQEGNIEWVQDMDTLDTWFSSGMWTFSTMAHKSEEIRSEKGKLIIDNEDFKNYHPTAVLETGYDIIFFWVARMIIMTTYAVEDIPFQDVYLHGLVRDEHGKKMSKSLGNVIDPLDMIKKYGTDAVRMALVVGTSPGNDMNLSEEKIAGFRNFTNKLWNIARYISGKSKDGSPLEGGKGGVKRGISEMISGNNLTLADKWILEKLENVVNSVTDDIENYRFSQAGETLREFTWDDFADWYLEVSKFEKSQQSPAGDCCGERKKDEILMHILNTLLKLWHPFMPYVTEKIWEEMGKEKILMVEKWPVQKNKKTKKQKNNNFENDFEIIKNIITSIRNARSQYKINPSEKIKAVIYAGDKKELIASQSDLIKKLRTGIDELDIREKGEKIKDAIYITTDGVEIYLVVQGFDFSAEAARIEKEIKEMENRISGLKKRLANTDFVQRAPEKIVQGEKDKLAAWESDLGKMQEQVKNLK